MLREAGHAVSTVSEEGLQGRPDPAVLDRARSLSRVLVTQNVRDFRELHEADPAHSGILAVCHERNRFRDMGYADIVHAIGRLEASGLDIAGEFHVLNVWR